MGDGLMENSWRCAYATVAGTSHIKFGAACQDRSECRIVLSDRNGPVLLAIACDGAGTASRSAIGAELTCGLFFDELGSECRSRGARSIDRALAERWAASVRSRLEDVAARNGDSIRDYACTALAAVVGEECAAFLQIGDGAIVVSAADRPDDYGWVFWPQHGEYASSTNFIVEGDSHAKLEFEAMDRRIDQVAIFTDGIERLVLNLSAKAVHAPFFRPLFDWLTKEGEPGSVAQSDPLQRYLASSAICDRTDDDKTLILATRRGKSANDAIDHGTDAGAT